jgi:hypothetical protein
MLSGFTAVFLRKGSNRHALAGKVFVVSMLSLAASGVVLAVGKGSPGDALGGTFTFYLVATAWRAGRQRTWGTGIFDWVGMVLALGFTAVEATLALQAATSPSGMKYGYSPGPYIMLGTVALFASVGDVRLLLRGGISGTPRIARHLWRMCFGLFIAAASIFLARQRLFPEFLQKIGMLYFLSVLPLLLLIFWMIRVRFTNAYQERLRVPVQLDAVVR